MIQGRTGLRRHHTDGRLSTRGMARELERVCLLQDRSPWNRRESCAKLIRLGGDAYRRPGDGEEVITLMADLDAALPEP
jgi:hypothetical protein